MNSFYKLIASIIKEAEAFSGHASFRVVDNDAVGSDPIRELSLDAVPLDSDNVMVTLSWEGGVKEFEKTMSSKEADHMFQLISTDLSHIVSLTSEQKFEEAKEAMKNVLKTYAETTDTPVSTTAPKLNTTQASIEIKAEFFYGSEDIGVYGDASFGHDHIRAKLSELVMPWSPDLAKELEGPMSDDASEEYEAIDLLNAHTEEGLYWNFVDGDLGLWAENELEASKIYNKILCQAKVSLRNIFPSGTVQQIEFENTKELQEYQGKGTAQDAVPLWDLNKGKEKPQNTLSPSSLSYEDVEEEKAKEHENLTKHIDETIKNELESALQEKAASVFGPADVELVKSMRAPGIGRNWDEVKKYFVKELNRDKDATTIFLDEQRKLSGDESVEVTVEEKKPEDALRPPENLVSPETHDKLLEDLKKKEPVEEVKEKEIEKVEPPIKETSSKEDDKYTRICPSCKSLVLPEEMAGPKHCDLCEKHSNFTPKDIMAISELDEIARADNADIRKVAAKCEVCEDIKSEEDPGREYDPTCVGYLCPKHEEEYHNKKKSSLKVKADDLNPLQEPITEAPTMETPKQDIVPMGKPEDHQAPSAGDWVMVKSDLKDELPAFKAKFVSEYMSNDGTEYATVETEDQDLLEVEMHRVTKITDSKPAAQEADPLATPEIEMPQEAPVPVTPKLSDLSSSQDELLSIKAEAEALLKDVQGMGKISFKFIKKGLEKHADDSAFEGNGWCRVWIQEDEIASDSRYPEILKLSDENAKIAALKDLARDMAHEALRLADSAGAKVGVQTWFGSLTPSDHDRIDWVVLANPQIAESSLKQADSVMDTKCEECGEPLGPEAFLSKWPVCGKCTRKRHKKVTGSDFEKGISQNKTSAEGLFHIIGNLAKMVTAYNEESQDWSGKMQDFGFIDKINFEINSKEEIIPELNKLYSLSFEAVEGEPGRYDSMQTENADGMEDPNGKWLADYSAYVKFYKESSLKVKADPTPLDAPQPTKMKDLKIAPKYVDRNMAQPATQEMDAVLSKMDELEQKLGILDQAKNEIQAKMKEQMAAIDQSGERVQMEAELQAAVEKAGILIDATEAKVVSWRDKLFTMQNEEVQLVPKLTQKELLAKIYVRFEGAEKYVQNVLNGMMSLAKTITEKTLIRFPNKKSNMEKKASPMDVMNQINEELLAALKELSTPL